MTKLVQIITVFLSFLLGASGAVAEDKDMSWLKGSDWVVDPQGLLETLERDAIREAAMGCFTDSGVPLRVVVVPSLAEYGGQGMQIDTYAGFLLEATQQSLLWDKAAQQDNVLLLLLVEEERQLRVALGSAWDSQFFASSRRAVKQEQDKISPGHSATKAALLATKHLAGMVRVSKRNGGGAFGMYAIAGGLLLILMAGFVIFMLRNGSGHEGLQEAVRDGPNTLIRQKLKRGADHDAFDDQRYTEAISA
ncbi:MAG: TPM domain-containing protein, partial [Candidatus Hydrogenedentes bacterium]|nr:TPM domain-containing protein [Candidatus Hydrogenedentota bacterium]